LKIRYNVEVREQRIEGNYSMRKTIQGKKVLEAPLLFNRYVCPGCMEDTGFRIIKNESVKEGYEDMACPIRFYALCKKCKVIVSYVKDLSVKKK
jgi:hypothetical protein